jgi:hypothetical protein
MDDARKIFMREVDAENEERGLHFFEPLEPSAPTNRDELREIIETLADEAGTAVGELEKQISEIRDSLNELRSSLEVERKLKVIDLPDWRKKNAAA